MRRLLFEVNQSSYLDSLKKFEVGKLKDNANKVLQMKWEAEVSRTSKMVYGAYEYQVSLLYRTKGLSLEEKKLELIKFVEILKEKHPERFSKVGWYDLSSLKELSWEDLE